MIRDLGSNKNLFKKQSITITLTSIIGSMINGIVAYIAVYFFKPIWEKYIVKLWGKK